MKTRFIALFIVIITMTICMLPASAYVSAKLIPGTGMTPFMEPWTVEAHIYPTQPIGQDITFIVTDSSGTASGTYSDDGWIYFAYWVNEYTNPLNAEVITTPPPGSPYYADYYAFGINGETTAYVTIVPVINKWSLV